MRKISLISHLAFLGLILVASAVTAKADRIYYVYFTTMKDNDVDTHTGNKEVYPDLYRMNPDGSNQLRLTHNPKQKSCFTPTSDGKRLLYMLGDDNIGYDIMMMDNDGRNDEFIIDDFDNSNLLPDISGDQSFIVYTTISNREVDKENTDSELVLKHLETGETRKLTQNREWEAFSKISPDGRFLVFKRLKRNDNEWSSISNLIIYNIETGEEKIFGESDMLTSDDIKFSRDGKFLAVKTNEGGARPLILYSWPEMEVIAKYKDFYRFKFSYDGSKLIADCKDTPTGRRLEVVDLKNNFSITSIASNTYVLGDFNVSPDGQTVFFTGIINEGDSDFIDIYRIETNGTGLKRLTDFKAKDTVNDIWLTVSPFVKDDEDDENIGDDTEENSDQ